MGKDFMDEPYEKPVVISDPARRADIKQAWDEGLEVARNKQQELGKVVLADKAEHPEITYEQLTPLQKRMQSGFEFPGYGLPEEKKAERS